jgi:Transposase IS66 family
MVRYLRNFNFNKDAYLLLEQFEAIVKLKLLEEKVLNADETGINVNKKTLWLHFTNNSGENDLKMTKVQQKISGCFRSIEGARIFCGIRSYLLTSQKHGVKMTEALELLFQGMPEFRVDLKTGAGTHSGTGTIVEFAE